MKSQQGNVLFLILIAVALFAALSYAVTSASRTGDATGAKEKTGITVGQILGYSAELQTAYQRVRIARNCSDATVSYENPYNVAAYVNPSSPADKSCHIFSSEGGGLIPLTPTVLDPAQVTYPNEQWQFMWTTSTNGFGTSADDLFAYGKVGSQVLCDAINAKVNGITSTPTLNIAILASGVPGHTAFTPDFAVMNGSMAGCFYTGHVWSMGYWFYQVLRIQ